ncbi:MAG: di-trans,poly-cis-decaprenylcistransferase [Ureaplasma sp.]|nr:di-trans,poly-cis-decaprenylcistransferase [Ureaplasma sp.]MDE7221762.1 di-trans,poly-cis-decaprenylcistransferase [Ureaplasma sp.]
MNNFDFYYFHRKSLVLDAIKKINHIGFIMDGNRRWAKRRFLLPINGHKKGLETMHNIINYAVKILKINVLTFYTFSTENWKRDDEEINYLMNLILNQLNDTKFEEWLMQNNVQFIWNGFESKLDKEIINKIQYLMNKTINNTGTKLQILLNYGSQQKIVEAINEMMETKHQPIALNDLINKLDKFNLGPIDLLIRTGKEQRLSNFMLFELAYSEIIFRKCYWPSYSRYKLDSDLIEFSNRKRRFGK